MGKRHCNYKVWPVHKLASEPVALPGGFVDAHSTVTIRKTQTKLRWNHSEWCLLRPVGVDQSEQTGTL